MLARRGFVGEICGTTPHIAGPRGQEVQAWLDQNSVDSFVIIDDADEFASLKSRHVHTDAHYGLSGECVDRAIEVLSCRV